MKPLLQRVAQDLEMYLSETPVAREHRASLEGKGYKRGVFMRYSINPGRDRGNPRLFSQPVPSQTYIWSFDGVDSNGDVVASKAVQIPRSNLADFEHGLEQEALGYESFMREIDEGYWVIIPDIKAINTEVVRTAPF